MRALTVDIETTGITADNYQTTAIGYKFNNADFPTVMFAYKPSDEKKMLYEFSKVLDEVETLITWKGKGFDVPFLKTRGVLLGVDLSRLSKIPLIDLQLVVENEFMLSQTRLKDVTALFDIKRTDTLDGSQIARLYNEYARTSPPDKKISKIIITHCQEDVMVISQLYELLKEYIRDYNILQPSGQR
jgi:uncharacterized protein YprB with RNaseH-like and TPR domain